MVSPVLLIATTLGFAFLYPLVERLGRVFAAWVALALLAAFGGVSVHWLISLIAGAAPLVAETAGFVAPLSIQLAVDLTDAFALSVITLIAIASLFHVAFATDNPWHGRQIVLFFVMLLGAYGLIMTRDLFNIFVFMEISGISLFGLLGTSRDGRVYEAGFKYMIASGLASIFFLIGTAFVYRTVGSLALADIAAAAPSLGSSIGLVGLLFLVTSILIELKPAPANGWALDTYQAADPGLGAMMSAIGASAMAFVLLRLLPILTGAAGDLFVPLLLGAGTIAFVVPQFQALLQDSLRRMVGYSSVAQIGLVVVAAAAATGTMSISVATIAVPVVLLLNHALAKSLLFWIASVGDDDRTGHEGILPASFAGRPVRGLVAVVAVLALLGLPPFPGFFAKWALVMQLGASGSYLVLALVLLGSLLEAVYLGRWLVISLRDGRDDGATLTAQIPADFAPIDAMGNRSNPDREPHLSTARINAGAGAGLAIVTLGLLALGAAATWGALGAGVIWWILAATGAFALLDLLRVPTAVSAGAAIAFLGWYAWYLIAGADIGLAELFVLIFAVGTAIQLVALVRRGVSRRGLVPLIVGLALSLIALVAARTALELVVAWEMMAITSFLLVLRGRRAAGGATRYLVFSLASALLMLGAFATGLAVDGSRALGIIAIAPGAPIVAVMLFLAAILIKLGAVGLHIWLPPSYAEAEDEVSAIVSSVLSKAGVLLLFVGATVFATPVIGVVSLNQLLGWVGLATAIVGGMMALFQEDIKYTLAYSSMSQLGYIVLSFALMSHLGWVAALYLAVNHVLFKGMLFLAVVGIVMRTGTRLMYQMGGLIKKMPFSFVSVLVAIIAVSGVPPLSGFGGKWLLYTALIEEGWYLQAAFALFSSGIAFLYLFRLIHVIFLGQRKAHHDTVREAPIGIVVPQFIFLGIIMAISMFPNILIQPLQAMVEPAFTTTVAWDGYAVISSLGYWNGNAVMYVVIGVFVAPLIWLLAVKGRTYRIEQFNIVYAAERPHTPESTHVGYNFYAHYQKAFGRLLDPWVERFWGAVGAAAATISQTLRAWNTGNPQTYAFQVMLYLLGTYLVVRGGI